MFKCNVGNDQMDFVRKAKRCNRVHQSIKRAPHAPIWYLNKLSLKMYNIVYPSIMMPINNKRPPPAPVTASAVCPRPPQHGSRRCSPQENLHFQDFQPGKSFGTGRKIIFLQKLRLHGDTFIMEADMVSAFTIQFEEVVGKEALFLVQYLHYTVLSV